MKIKLSTDNIKTKIKNIVKMKIIFSTDDININEKFVLVWIQKKQKVSLTLERQSGSCCSLKFNIFVSKMMNKPDYFREVLNKTTVVVTESDERFNFPYVGRSWPGCNGFKLVRIRLIFSLLTMWTRNVTSCSQNSHLKILATS